MSRDRAAVQLDEMLGDRQAEAEPERGARGRCVLLPEALEHVRQERRRDALAVVLHRDLQPVRRSAARESRRDRRSVENLIAL